MQSAQPRNSRLRSHLLASAKLILEGERKLNSAQLGHVQASMQLDFGYTTSQPKSLANTYRVYLLETKVIARAGRPSSLLAVATLGAVSCPLPFDIIYWNANSGTRCSNRSATLALPPTLPSSPISPPDCSSINLPASTSHSSLTVRPIYVLPTVILMLPVARAL